MRGAIIGFLGFVFCLGVQAKTVPQIVETYGDSITRGYGAEFVLTSRKWTPLEVSWSTLKMAQTRGNRAKLDAIAKPNLAWPRHLVTALETDSQRITLYNQASTNTTANFLTNQVLGVPENKEALTWAFFFMGHNDVCGRVALSDEENIARFITPYRAALKQWEKRHRNATAYLMPVADISKVYHLMWDYAWSADGRHSCANTYQLYAPLCRPVAEHVIKGDDDKVVGKRTQKLNEALKDLAKEMNDQKGENDYVYLESLERLDLKREYFSIDCFHLNKNGQGELANLLLRLVS